MNALKTLALCGLAAASISQAHGMEPVPVWQEPGYIMDELVVTMYEIIVTAQAPSSTPGRDALAEVAAALEAQIREIVAAAQQPEAFVTKISSNGRILFAHWRI